MIKLNLFTDPCWSTYDCWIIKVNIQTIIRNMNGINWSGSTTVPFKLHLPPVDNQSWQKQVGNPLIINKNGHAIKHNFQGKQQNTKTKKMSSHEPKVWTSLTVSALNCLNHKLLQLLAYIKMIAHKPYQTTTLLRVLSPFKTPVTRMIQRMAALLPFIFAIGILPAQKKPLTHDFAIIALKCVMGEFLFFCGRLYQNARIKIVTTHSKPYNILFMVNYILNKVNYTSNYTILKMRSSL